MPAFGQATGFPVTEPIVWDPPSDDRLWMWDDVHFPRPVPLLSYELIGESWEAGLNAAADTYRTGQDARLARINGYIYQGVRIGEPGQDSDALLFHASTRLAARWKAEWLPVVHREIRRLKSIEQAIRGGTAEPTTAFGEIRDSLRICWTVHFQLLLPVFYALGTLGEVLVGDGLVSSETEAAVLAGGSLRRSWRLQTDLLRASRTMRSLGTSSTDDIPEALFAKWGSISPRGIDLSQQRWDEDRSVVLGAIRATTRGEDRHPGRDRLGRRRIMESLRRRLGQMPRPLAEDILARLDAARQASALSEMHTHEIDETATYQARRALLALGRSFGTSLPGSDGDLLWHMSIAELEEVAHGGHPATADELERRRRSLSAFELVKPRQALEAQLDLSMTPPAILRAQMRFFGVAGTSPSQEVDADLLRGFPASLGSATGRARVVADASELGAVEAGDVLVTPTASAAYAPALSLVSGIVTEAGGPLSHIAILAREFGTPCVVGVRGATSRISSGTEVTIDGTLGTVALGRNQRLKR
jgi:phosphohistidine swiveling domain-containing protein